jgi:hypothetical protein
LSQAQITLVLKIINVTQASRRKMRANRLSLMKMEYFQAMEETPQLIISLLTTIMEMSLKI